VRKRGIWFALAGIAVAPVAGYVWSGCQGTCTTSADCGDGTFCSQANGVCDTSRALGFCLPIPPDCPESTQSPVCGCDNVTYLNACQASQHGQSLSAGNACVPNCGPLFDAGCPDGSFCEFAASTGTTSSSSSVCGNNTNVPGVCANIPATCSGVAESPVCGCDGKTFASHCDAQKAEVSVAAQGACTCGGLDNRACQKGEFCNLPVGTCDTPGTSGSCSPVPAKCDTDFSPVCGCDGTTYNNACVAAQAKVSLFTSAFGGVGMATGGCPCGGPSGGTCSDGFFCSYTSGTCLMADAVGACLPIPDPTTCEAAVSVVCGCDNNAYNNACLAGAAGVSVAINGPCSDGGVDGG
jgi:hypothetical protein